VIPATQLCRKIGNTIRGNRPPGPPVPPVARPLLGALAVLVVAVSAVVAACTPPVEERRAAEVGGEGVHYEKVAFAALPGWPADDHAAALTAFVRSCPRLEASGADTVLGGNRPGGPGAYVVAAAGDWRAACATARRVPVGDRGAAREFFQRQFTPFAISVDGNGEGLFTGYFEPQLSGSWHRDARFRVPLYRPPADLATSLAANQPHHPRSAIDAGVLAGQNLELLWVDDPLDAFFLHIQGSGRVAMADGEVVRVGFAAKNGHPYFAIGRELVARGAIAKEDVTMQSIRAWLQNHPSEAQGVMALNPSYVFFRIIDGAGPDDGPIGAMGVPLTPERSLAVDPAFVPYGAPVWLDTADPLAPGRPLRRLLIAQDTGTAIKGAVRGDVFWGHGNEAAARAGAMRAPGRAYLLIPNAAHSS
jgi:membrane-bound lytic murein transglycosylase A